MRGVVLATDVATARGEQLLLLFSFLCSSGDAFSTIE